MFYSVNVYLKSECDDDSPSLWEERILLVSAFSEEEAINKANKYCDEDYSYKVESGATIHWSLYKVDRAYLIDELKDGAELFSRFVKEQEALSLLTPFED